MSTPIPPGDRGRWIRSGARIILLPGIETADAGGGMQGEMSGAGTPLTWNAVMRPDIDVSAQRALMRMAGASPAERADAQRILGAVQAGALGGIYQPDQLVPLQRAKAFGLNWWDLMPPAGGGTVVPPGPDGAAPLITFAKSLANDFGRLAGVLRTVFEEFARIYVKAAGNRLRVSVWASAQMVTRERLEPMRGFVDDVSLTRTVQIGLGAGPLQLIWDTDSQPGRPYPELVKECHLQGVQVLAGFAIVPENKPGEKRVTKADEGKIGTRFNLWLQKATDEEMQQFARRIRVFLLSGRIDDPNAAPLEALRQFDGISFDVESLSHAAVAGFTRFVGIVADELKPFSLWVAVAVPPRVQDSKKGLAALSLPEVAGRANVIVRPMAYDRDATGKFLLDWQQKVMDYALSTKQLPSQQLQMGLATGNGGKGRVTPEEVIERCRGMLRDRRVGLVIWYLENVDTAANDDFKRPRLPGNVLRKRGDRWKDYDDALNGSVKAVWAGELGEPIQAPLDSRARLRIVPLRAPITRPGAPRPAGGAPVPQPRVPRPTIPAPRPWNAFAARRP